MKKQNKRNKSWLWFGFIRGMALFYGILFCIIGYHHSQWIAGLGMFALVVYGIMMEWVKDGN